MNDIGPGDIVECIHAVVETCPGCGRPTGLHLGSTYVCSAVGMAPDPSPHLSGVLIGLEGIGWAHPTDMEAIYPIEFFRKLDRGQFDELLKVDAPVERELANEDA